MSKKDITEKNIISSIAEAYILITQEANQYLYNEQILNINCNADGTSTACIDCINSTKKVLERGGSIVDASGIERIKEICKNPCRCNVNNINMAQTISINFSLFMNAGVKGKFVKNVLNSFYAKSLKSGTYLYPTDQRNTTIMNSISQLYDRMQSSQMQQSLQGLKSLQIINVRGPASVAHIDVNSAIDYVSTILLKSKEISSTIKQVLVDMVSLTVQVLDASLSQLIYRIVQIVIVIVMLIATVFIINLSFTIYGLYV